jgi:ssDNA-binding replication factor A large subunit
MHQNYEKIIEKIARVSNLDKAEIERRVEAKRAKLSGLISKEGAAQVIAAELGISFDNEKLKIDELLPGMRKANVFGKVINIFPVREFEKNGKSGKVVNLIIADETSNIKVVLWDTNHIELIEKKQVNIGSIIEIVNASVRDNELHLGSFSEFKNSDEIIENVQTEMVSKEKPILKFRNMENVKTRAFIVQVFDPRFFNVCPQCKRKVTSEGENYSCQQHGAVVPEKRALLNIVIDDGTETMRSVLFQDAINSLGLDMDNKESLEKQKKELLGKEMFFSGNVRKNKFFNNMELIIERAEEIDMDALIKELEKTS